MEKVKSINKIRILIAKPGLDGHDRGAKVVAQALNNAGMEVIYLGLHQRTESIINTAIQEDVDVIGLSILSGAHLHICKELREKMQERQLEQVMLLVGGTIPERDFPRLKEFGVKKIFSTDSLLDDIIKFIENNVTQR